MADRTTVPAPVQTPGSAPARLARLAPTPRRLRRAGSARERWLQPGWPLVAFLLGFPLLWAMGGGVFFFPAVGFLLAVPLLLQRHLRVPRGFGLWITYVGWVVVSMVANHQLSMFPMFRLITFVSATMVFLWVYNSDPDTFPTHKAVGLLAGFWLITVIGGWIGVLIPSGQFTSPLEIALPSLRANQSVLQMVHPSFAQIQNVLGYPLGRPKAPFAYTNDWGAVYALCAPFFFYGWLQSIDPVRRRRGVVILGLSLVPVFISLNRGLWLGLGIALLNAAFRPGDLGRAARRVLVALLTVGVALLVFTPLSSVVADRASHGHSNEGRDYLYVAAIAKANEKPLVGWGNTIKVSTIAADKLLPPIGTQGHFWTVLVSQGWFGMLLFEAFLLRMWWATRRGPTVTFWAHATITVALVVQFTYDFVPIPFILIFFAMALGLRDAHRRVPSEDLALT